MIKPYTPQIRMNKRKPVNKSRKRALNKTYNELRKSFKKMFYKEMKMNGFIYINLFEIGKTAKVTPLSHVDQEEKIFDPR